MATTSNPAGLYACGLCKAEYSRADHLIRHVRSHTRQRPFVCSICAKGFGRQDLLKRHMTTHNAGTSFDPDVAMGRGTSNGRNSHRVHQACRACSEKKLKCTDEKPCKRCSEKNIFCDFDSDAQGYNRPTASDTSQPFQPDHSNGNGFVPPAPDNNVEVDENISGHDDSQYPISEAFSAVEVDQPNEEMTTPRDLTVRDMLDGALNLPVMSDYVQFDQDSIFEDTDFSFCSNLFPSELPPLFPVPSVSETSPQTSTISIGAEAYRTSTVFAAWNPRKEDSHHTDQQDLVLPHDIEPSANNAQPPGTVATPKNDLSQSSRDQMLAMILRTSSRTDSHRIAGSFPTLQILQGLVRHALLHMQERLIGMFIHIPTLDLNKERPELVGSLVAYGCVVSRSPAVRKFGYALQETVRVAINQLVQEEHATLRELGVAQAFYLQLYLGYWSGISRKIELAESSSMLGVTMLRRGKRLCADQYHPPEVFMDLQDLTIQERWLKWVEQESMKRLVYFAMCLEFHVAPSRGLGTLFTCGEMGTPLPTSTTLWNAASANQWREVLAQDTTLSAQQPLPFNRVLRQPNLLANHLAVVDQEFTALACLGGFWSLVEEYWHMHSLLPDAQAFDDFVLKSRHTELSSILECFKSEFTDQIEISPEVQILQDLVGLHLHVSLDEIARYCGKGTEDDGRASAPYVQRWYQSTQSRAAIWHAGQILRATRLLPPGGLVDIFVAGLYHAALVLWVWGLLYKIQPSTWVSNGAEVVLDGSETAEVMKFLKSGRLKPYLTNQGGHKFPLEDLASVTELARDIITKNWGREPLPLTTMETFRFLQDFSKITRQRFDEMVIENFSG